MLNSGRNDKASVHTTPENEREREKCRVFDKGKRKALERLYPFIAEGHLLRRSTLICSTIKRKHQHRHKTATNEKLNTHAHVHVHI